MSENIVSNEQLLQMKGISKSFPGVNALDNVSFNLRFGEVHALLGENGAGKSTLIKILSGVYKPDAGEIVINGKPVEFRNPAEARTAGVGTIHQELMLVPNLTVAENLFLGREPLVKGQFINWNQLQKDASDLLEELSLPLDPNQQVKTLSIAKRQLVEIGKAMSQNIHLLIMDEPTSALSDEEIRHLMEHIHRLKNKGIGIIYISHRLEEVYDIADRTTVLRDGKFIGTIEKNHFSADKIIRMMVGREFAATEQRIHPNLEDQPILKVKGLCTPVVHDVSFELHRGEIVGIAGLMGSGRSEVARAVYGIDPMISGEVYVEGELVNPSHPIESINLGMGLAPEDRKDQALLLNLSVKDNITIAQLFRHKNGIRKHELEKQVATKYMKQLDIRTPHLTNEVEYLSGGNQQKTVIARWLAIDPKILILDEPTRGIDVGAKAEIHRLLIELAEHGVAILVISSELPELLTVSNRILVMKKGSLVAEMTYEEATQEKIMGYATGYFEGSGDLA